MIKISDKLGHIWTIDQKHFPDGSLHLDLPKNMMPTKIFWNYESDAELFTIICLKRKFQEDIIDLYLPFLPHARQDRVKDSSDVFTLKYFCEIINSLMFNNVYVWDVHSNVSLALLDRVQNVGPGTAIFHALNDIVYETEHDCSHEARLRCYDNLVFFFPDEGSMKRSSNFLFKMPHTFGVKDRDWKTGKIQSFQIINPDMVKGKNVLIIDDICSRGGTFLHSAKALKEAGAANIYLYITHAEPVMVEGEMYNTDGLIEKIYTTNSIFNPVTLDVKSKVELVEYI